MKTKLIAVVTLVVGLALVGTAFADHLAKCPGTWKLVKAERDGKALPKADIENVTLICKAEGKDFKITVKEGDKVVTEGTAKLHKEGGKDDKHDQYDITYTKGTNKDGDLKGKTVHGLISVDGDTMKVCWSGEKDHHPHPKELQGGKDSKCTLRTFERVKQ